MGRQRILIAASHYYPDYPSGANRLAFDEAHYLARQGHEVWLIGAGRPEGKPALVCEHGLKVLRYHSPPLRVFDPRRIITHQVQTQALLEAQLDTVDVVHGHSLLQYFAAQSHFGNKARMIYSVHSPARLELMAQRRNRSRVAASRLLLTALVMHQIERQCLVHSDCITAYSLYTRGLLEQLHGPPVAQKVQVIAGWVDLARFQILAERNAVKEQSGWPTDVPLLFTLRRLETRMGLDRLLHSLRAVKSAGLKFQLVIGGTGPLRAELEGLAIQLGLQADVRFVGLVAEDLLPLMYASADAFVLPTVELECFGLIAIEALACGTPVLATPVGAIPEILMRFEPRWLASGASVDAIAQLLFDYLSGRLPSHDRLRLRDTVAQYYSRDGMLPQFTKMIFAESAGDQSQTALELYESQDARRT